jgi:hypothetical protein
MQRTFVIRAVLLVLLGLHGAWNAAAAMETNGDAEEKGGRPKFLVLPVPFSNPTDGRGIGVGGVAFYNPNGGKHQWTSGVGGVWTSHGSRGIALVHKMYSANDRYRLNATGSWSKAQDRFYGVGADDGDRDDALHLDGRQFNLKLRGLSEVTESIYLGFEYVLLVNDLAPRQDEEPTFVPPPADQLDSTMSAIGPVAVYDTRDNHDEPRDGVNLAATWLIGMKALGDSFSHNNLTLIANTYQAIAANTVLAGRASLCSSSGDAAFYALCRYGSGKNLRGYPADRYRDRASWTMQGEVRHQFNSRWGGVAFIGVGGIAPSVGDILSDSNFLPAGGVGIRYRLFRKNDVRARLDFAYGKDASGIYLSFGEAF